MTTSHNKGFDNLLLFPVISSMAQERILVAAKGEDNKSMAIPVHISQWSSFHFSAQDMPTPA